MLSTVDRAKFRVKIKSLAAEAKVIRAEERRALRNRNQCAVIVERAQKLRKILSPDLLTAEVEHFTSYGNLRDHRVGVVRDEARATLLAYAFVRHVNYDRVEPHGKKCIMATRVAQIIKSLTGQTVPAPAITDWMKPAVPA